ncbi:MAG: thiamine pyrophosphate-binding protein, partial [Agathobacter sp.]|nr:thiamine pyrophosphate-binding protein [Agathobacter sp.]
KALYLCKNGRGGPVWLDIPLDIQAAIVETDDLIHFNMEECIGELPPRVDDKLVEEIVEKIKSAKRPIILAGTGIRLGDARQEFLQVIDKLQIPVVTAWNAHDVLWDTHPLYVGRPGTVGTRGGNFALENADLVLTLGCRLNIRQISYNYKDWAKNAYRIVVDIDKHELDKPTIFPDVKVHADVKDFLQVMLKVPYTVEKSRHMEWLEFCKRINEKYPAVLPEYFEKEKPINPYVFMKKLFDNLDEDETVVTGNGSACVISFQTAQIKKSTRLFTNSGCASMGYGLPAALGACIARNGKRVICLDGDGSLMMNLQEMQTVRYNNCNLKLFVLNNNGYHSIRQTQNNLFKNGLVGVCDGNGVSFPPFNKVADTFGFRYFKMDTLDCIETVLAEALEAEGPVLCEVILDDSQNFEPKLSSKVLPDGKIVSPPIDDMFPFLDRKEYEANKIR